MVRPSGYEAKRQDTEILLIVVFTEVIQLQKPALPSKIEHFRTLKQDFLIKSCFFINYKIT